MELVRVYRKYFESPEDLAASMSEEQVAIEQIPNTGKFLVIKAGLVEEFEDFEDLDVEVQNVLIETDADGDGIDEPTRISSVDVEEDDDMPDSIIPDDLVRSKDPDEMAMHSESKVLKFGQFNMIAESKKAKKSKKVARKPLNESKLAKSRKLSSKRVNVKRKAKK